MVVLMKDDNYHIQAFCNFFSSNALRMIIFKRLSIDICGLYQVLSTTSDFAQRLCKITLIFGSVHDEKALKGIVVEDIEVLI